jgi:hypothetical protein
MSQTIGNVHAFVSVSCTIPFRSVHILFRSYFSFSRNRLTEKTSRVQGISRQLSDASQFPRTIQTPLSSAGEGSRAGMSTDITALSQCGACLDGHGGIWYGEGRRFCLSRSLRRSWGLRAMQYMSILISGRLGTAVTYGSQRIEGNGIERRFGEMSDRNVPEVERWRRGGWLKSGSGQVGFNRTHY